MFCTHAKENTVSYWSAEIIFSSELLLCSKRWPLEKFTNNNFVLLVSWVVAGRRIKIDWALIKDQVVWNLIKNKDDFLFKINVSGEILKTQNKSPRTALKVHRLRRSSCSPFTVCCADYRWEPKVFCCMAMSNTFHGV